MRYPRRLKEGDSWGVTATSSGVYGFFSKRLDKAIDVVKNRGYKVIETESVRNNKKLVSASGKKRAEEFTSLYKNDNVGVIAPPWGGEFLIDMLPYIDESIFEKYDEKWFLGYSDNSSLQLYMTTKFDIATVHGITFVEYSGNEELPSTKKTFEILESNDEEVSIRSLDKYQKEWNPLTDEKGGVFNLTEEVKWRNIYGDSEAEFEGRIIGGCLDVIKCLLGTPYEDVKGFIERYKKDGFIWYFESCEMDISDISRTLWQMKMNGWFENCTGVLYGRSDELQDRKDFTFEDGMKMVFDDMNIPVIRDVDIGHIPPQIPIVNGSLAKIQYKEGKGKVEMRFE